MIDSEEEGSEVLLEPNKEENLDEDMELETKNPQRRMLETLSKKEKLLDAITRNLLMKKLQLSRRNTKADIGQAINTKNPNNCTWKKRNASEAKDPRGKPFSLQL